MARPILLIEDDPDDEALVRRALSGSRVPNDVIAVRDGGEALDYLFALGAWRHRQLDEQPMLVLLDIGLPTVNGFEVLRQIRADPLTRHLPVVMLTSSRHQGDVFSSYDAGANSYVVKPVDLDQFLALTRELGRYWAQISETPSKPGEVEPPGNKPANDVVAGGPQLLLYASEDGWLGTSPPPAAAQALEAAAVRVAATGTSESIEIRGSAAELASRAWHAVLRRLPGRDEDARVAVALVDRAEVVDVERRLSRYDRVLLATQDAVWDWNVLTQEAWWNPSQYEMLGYDTSVRPSFEAWASRIHPDDRTRVLQGFDHVLRSKATTWRDEYRNLLPDGRVVVIGDYGYVERDAVGRPVRLIGVSRDITARRDSPQAARGSDINASCRRVENLLRRLIGSELELVMQLAEPIDEVRAGAGQIEQALLELVISAREVMLAGGRVVVQTRNVSVTNRSLEAGTWLEPGDYVALEVHSEPGDGAVFRVLLPRLPTGG